MRQRRGRVEPVRAYSYDEKGLLGSIETLDGVWTYRYDAIGQLTTAIYISVNGLIDDQHYQYLYDASGNRIETISNGETVVYEVDEMNRYTRVGDFTYKYDADGNMIEKKDTVSGETWVFEWCQGNWLRASVKLDADGNIVETWEYEYDAFGNRIAVVHNGERTEYLVDLSGNGNVIAEYDPEGNIVTTYVHGDYGLSSRSDAAGNALYYGYDALGSTAIITDAAGTIVNQYVYDPFGQSLFKMENIANPFQYVGQYGIMTGTASEFLAIRARWYDTNTGRFISEDPVGLKAGDANLYRYCLNDPINQIDITGEGFFSWVAKAAKKLVKTVTEIPLVKTIVKTVEAGINLVSNTIQHGWDYAKCALGFDMMDVLVTFTIDLATVAIASVTAGAGAAVVKGIGSVIVIGVDIATDVGARQTCKQPSNSDAPSTDNQGSVVAHVKTQIRGSVDPISSPGSGGEGWVQEDQTLSYRINFNNLETTTTVYYVSIVNPLSEMLNWNTLCMMQFRFGDIIVTIPKNASPFFYEQTIGSAYFSYKLNAETGQMTIILQSVDGTGFIGSKGSGFIEYTIQPKSGLATGDSFINVAAVSFNGGDWIQTNQVDPLDSSKGVDPTKEAKVTIDNTAPTSSISATRDGSAINVNWSGSDTGSGVACYNVYVSVNGGLYTKWKEKTTALGAEYAGIIGNTYSFYAVAYDNVGLVGTRSAFATVSIPLNAPSGINFSNTLRNSTTLAWAASTNATGYDVRYRIAGTSDWINLPSAIGTTLAITDLNVLTEYDFQVRATNKNGVSEWSSVVSVETLPPDVPGNPLLSNTTSTTTELSWTASADTTGYEVRYRISGTEWSENLPVSVTNMPFSNLQPLTAYEFQVRAMCANGSSDWSATVSIETKEIPSVFVDTLLDVVGDDGKTSLREAIANAADGDTISFDPALYGQSIVLDGNELFIDKNITIDATGTGIVIDANELSRVFSIDAGVTLELLGITITGGNADFGGGIFNAGVLRVSNCTIVENTATESGGGIYCDIGLNNSMLVVSNCTITKNSASESGGGIFGGIYDYETGMLNITNSIISENTASRGGGVFIQGSMVILRTGNTTDSGYEDEIFGQYDSSPDRSLMITNSSITGNSADSGGGIFNSSDLAMTGCSISENTAHEKGGGIYNDSGDLEIAGCIISENRADEKGGGVFSTYGVITVAGCTITGNTASQGGGFLSDNCTLSVVDCSVVENTAEEMGGGIFNSFGMVSVTGGTITGNTALQGGGVYNENGSLALAQNLIAENSASEGGGGGIYGEDGTLELTNCTIAGNLSDSNGGGIYNNSASVTINNTIVAKNGSSDIYVNYTNSATLSGRYNLIGDRTGQSNLVDGLNGNIVGTGTNPINPLFVDFEGGDYRLLDGSPAIDAGNNAYAFDAEGNPLTTDLGGNLRIMGAIVEIGAYEFKHVETPSVIVTTLLDVLADYDAVISLREAIAYAGTNGLGTRITFAPELYDRTIILNGSELLIEKDLIIDATGTNITIDADQQSRVFNIVSETTVELVGLTITGGYVYNTGGGGIYNAGILTVTNCIVTHNTVAGTMYSGNGGGIFSGYWNEDYPLSTLTVTGSTISNNSANNSGGGIIADYLIMTDSIILENSASQEGGGIYNTTSGVMLVNCEIQGNSAGYNGSGVYVAANNNSEIVIANCIISNNLITGTNFRYGAGICVNGDSAYTTITDSIITDNIGCGIYLENSSLPAYFRNNTISNNSGAGISHGDNAWGSVVIESCIIQENGGDGIDLGNNNNVGYLNVSNSTIQGNSGFGITSYNQDPYASRGYLEVSNSTIQENETGGIRMSGGQLLMTNCVIRGNSTPYSNRGAGIYSEFSTVTLTDCTISNNFSGYAIYQYYGELTVVNSIITENVGGGIYSWAGDEADFYTFLLSLTNSTIANNLGTGIYLYLDIYRGTSIYWLDDGQIVINNTIVANNFWGDTQTDIENSRYIDYLQNKDEYDWMYGDVYEYEYEYEGEIYYEYECVYEYVDLYISGSNNLIGNGDGQLTFLDGVDGNIVGTTEEPINPKFIDAEGGDYRLAVGSPAIDAGNNALAFYDNLIKLDSIGLDPQYHIPLRTDLGKNQRIANGRVDIGAYEHDSIVPPPLDTPTLTLVAVTDKTISLSWSETAEATAYLIEYTRDNEFTYWQRVELSETSTTLTDLAANTPYFIRVTAIGTATYGDSNPSAIKSLMTEKTTITLAVPTLNEVSVNANGSVGLGWSAVTNASGYVIQYSTDPEFINDIITLPGVSASMSSANIGGLDADTTYYFRIRAIGIGTYGNSDYSGPQAVTHTVAATLVTGSTAFAAEANIFALSAEDESTGEANTSLEKTVTITNSTITVNSAAKGGGIFNTNTTLMFYNTIIAENYGSEIVNDTALPGVFTGSHNLTTFDGWGDGAGENYRYDSSSPLFTDPVNGDYRLATGSQAINKGHNGFALRRYDLDGNARISNGTVDLGAYESVVSPTVPEFPYAEAISTNEIIVSWEFSEWADRYDICRSISESDGFTFVASTDDQFFIDTGLEAGTTYYYRIYAYSMETELTSEDFATAFATTAKVKLTVPILVTVNAVGANSVTANWSETANANGYVIQYSTDSAFADETTQKTGTLTGTSHTIPGLSASTTYYIRITATGTGTYCNSDSSASKSATTNPGTPTVPVAEVLSSNEILVSWQAAEGADRYKVYRSLTESEGFVLITTTAALFFEDFGLAAGTTYYYRVFAYNTETELESADYVFADAATPDYSHILAINFNGAGTGFDITFSESMDIARKISDGSIVSHLEISNSITGPLQLTPSQFSYNKETHTLTWNAGSLLPPGNYDIVFNSNEFQSLEKGTLSGGSGVNLPVQSILGDTEADAFEFMFAVNNPVPIIRHGNLTVQEGCSTFFSGLESYDYYEKGLEYFWDLDGDGIYETEGTSFWYSTVDIDGKPGATRTISLKVRNEFGYESDPVDVVVEIIDIMPCYYVLPPRTEELLAGNYTFWTFHAVDIPRDPVMQWVIDWGDGSDVTIINGGIVNHVSVVHTFEQAGEYRITATTTDDDGIDSTVVLGHYIVAAAPVPVQPDAPADISVTHESISVAQPETAAESVAALVVVHIQEPSNPQRRQPALGVDTISQEKTSSLQPETKGEPTSGYAAATSDLTGTDVDLLLREPSGAQWKQPALNFGTILEESNRKILMIDPKAAFVFKNSPANSSAVDVVFAEESFDFGRLDAFGDEYEQPNEEFGEFDFEENLLAVLVG